MYWKERFGIQAAQSLDKESDCTKLLRGYLEYFVQVDSTTADERIRANLPPCFWIEHALNRLAHKGIEVKITKDHFGFHCRAFAPPIDVIGHGTSLFIAVLKTCIAIEIAKEMSENDH